MLDNIMFLLLGFILGIAVISILWISCEMGNAPEMDDPDVIRFDRRDDE